MLSQITYRIFSEDLGRGEKVKDEEERVTKSLTP